MRYLCWLGLIGFFWLSAGTARADRVAEPRAPQEKVLTGTLSWQDVKQSDGTTVRRLVLTTGDRQIVLPQTSGTNIKSTKDGETIDVAAFVDKQVKVTAKVIDSAKRNPSTVMLSVTHIEDESASAAQSKAASGPQLADPKHK